MLAPRRSPFARCVGLHYPLGVILFEMLAGRSPFLGPAAIDYMAQHSFDEPPQLQTFAPTLPADVLGIVHRLLVKNKALRPAMSVVTSALLTLSSRASGAMQAAAQPEPDFTSVQIAVVPARAPEAEAVPAPEPVPVPADVTLIPGPPSTLGASLGQTAPPSTTKRLTRRRLLALGGGVVGLVLGLWGLSHLGSEPTPAVAPVRVISAAPHAKRPAPPPPTPAPADPPPAAPSASHSATASEPPAAPRPDPAPAPAHAPASASASAGALRRPARPAAPAHRPARPQRFGKKRIAVED